MNGYPEFAEKFLAAIYWETEIEGRDYNRVVNVCEKYGIEYKGQWISRLADEWEHLYFRDVSKVLGGYDGWSFRISGQGARKVEEDFPNQADLRAFLGIDGTDDLENLINQVAPASDRVVNLKDNQPAKAEIVREIREIAKIVSSSNEMDVQEKSDLQVSLTAAESVVQNSETWLLGALRYLVFDRIKKAFERTIEDALRVMIIASLTAIVIIVMAFV